MTKETIITTDQYILLTITPDSEKSLSWEEIQVIKDRIFPKMAFIEIYPDHNCIVNNVNQRHLYHVRGMKLPCLTELSLVEQYKIYTDE